MRVRGDFWNVGGLIVLWAVCCVAIGAAFRLMAWLFCLGYGC